MNSIAHNTPSFVASLVHLQTPWFLRVLLLGLFAHSPGCQQPAVEHAAASAVRRISEELQHTFDEYHRDVSLFDERREADVLEAFIANVQANPSGAQDDARRLRDALAKIRVDRDTATYRFLTASDNLMLLDEIAGGLERIGQRRALFQSQASQEMTNLLLNRKN